jgi:four helix bundle protein
MMKVQDLPAYQSSFNLAMSIFEMTKSFPVEELDAVTNPIRRSSRNVCIHLSEAMRRRKYVKYYQSTLIDAASANAETQTWLEFATACQYIDEAALVPIYDRCIEIGKNIQHMMDHPERFK